MARIPKADVQMLDQINKEKRHWRDVLTRILAVVQYLAENNSAFRGKTEKLYQPHNGKFLGLIEMLAKLDPTIQEHVRRIKDGETHDHYLGHQIQNEFIELMASEVKKIIIAKLKLAKYFSIILDCTPDVSHKEQLSLIVRFVDASDCDLKVVEHFMEFFIAENTTGKGLSELLLAALEKLGLDIDDCRGQGYDNGANMKGKHLGVQAHILRKNSRAFFTPCGCHSLNLVLGDMAKISSKAVTFFGVLQRIYVIFAGSPARWKILEEAVPYITVKSLSDTRWECRIESVKALRYQISEIKEALFTVSDESKDPMVKAEAESLANFEVGNFEFILAVIIWYDILFAVNTVSKSLQSADMQLDVAIQQIKGLVTYLTNYRENGFNSAMITAKEIAKAMDVDQVFKQKRSRKRKRQFEYESTDDSTLSGEDEFRTEYFLCIMDQAIIGMNTRFEQLRQYDSLFGFLYNINTMRKLNNEDLLKSCMNLDIELRSVSSRDLNGADLCTELTMFREILPEVS
ncbi:zinc finger MYM-type protein 1-like [Physella acuta]|uniref:zinc finger MYM-type protein 1-like n=1 Tax=Physella acuta TaxID=109671 RepID=UPI0027DB1D01|nr:zinc finger MYM-type protein 1-like [Physella acuta]